MGLLTSGPCLSEGPEQWLIGVRQSVLFLGSGSQSQPASPQNQGPVVVKIFNLSNTLVPHLKAKATLAALPPGRPTEQLDGR